MSVILWLAYFFVPSESTLIDGVPLGRLETIGVVLVLWIAAHRIRIAGAWVAAAVTVAAVVVAAAVPGHRGLNARYFATAAAGGAHERSTEYRDPAFTRVDSRLDFTRGERDFPLAFFNDHTRFNFMRMGEPDRRALEFAAAWTAWLHVPDDGPRIYYLHAPRASAQVSIDTSQVLAAVPTGSDSTTELALSEGWHRIHITFSSPYGAPREFSAGELRGGVRVPFDRMRTRTDRIDQRQMMLAAAWQPLKDALDTIALMWLAALATMVLMRRIGEVWQRRVQVYPAAIALFVAAGVAEALRFAWPWATRLRIMAAGDDTMVYEGYARDILLNGVLMNAGQPPGAGEPFYFQAFYPYFLAFTHAVVGEGFFGALFLQRVLVALTAVALVRTAIALRGQHLWPTALIVSSAFVYWKLAPISADMLSESLYVPLLATWTMLCVELAVRPGNPKAVLAGITGGLTTITRTTILLAWPLAWGSLYFHLRRSPRRTWIIATVAAISLAIFSLIAIRNALVSHRFVPMPSEFGITLRGGNEPPPGVDPGKHKALYDALRVDGHTAEVIEYALTAPAAFLANTGRKALFVLGFYEAWVPGWGYSPVYIAAWLSALAGLWLARRSSDGAGPWYLPALIALTQFVAIVIVYPRGERLIVPIHTLLIPYSAIVADQLARFITASPAPPKSPPSAH